ncbi:MAG TPA: MarR family transcriptional regulator [Longimicrobiales bacterium]|nr:MarR family transcriptional regulator [Longimicrobiales bacterium]
MADQNRKEAAEARFVERMGHILESDGLTRIAGRIFGHLLLSSEPQSLEDLAKALHASKGSISQDTRLLERLGALERVTHPGDRRVFYQIGDRMMGRMVALRLERFAQLREAMSEGVAAASDEKVRARLNEFVDFHDHLLVTMREARDRWCARHGVAEK